MKFLLITLFLISSFCFADLKSRTVEQLIDKELDINNAIKNYDEQITQLIYHQEIIIIERNKLVELQTQINSDIEELSMSTISSK